LVYLSRDRDTRIKILFLVGIIFLVTNFIIYPRLDSATKGALTARFAKKDLTGRDGLLRNEIELWRRNPLLGVGPGMGKYHRLALAVGAHTEYTRLLSEHGTFGLLAIGCLLLIAIQNLKRGGTNVSRAVVASSLVWSALFMASAAMRLAAPAFMFALSYVNLARTEQPSRKRQAKRVVRRLFIT
jgi:hypothetical protein